MRTRSMRESVGIRPWLCPVCNRNLPLPCVSKLAASYGKAQTVSAHPPVCIGVSVQWLLCGLYFTLDCTP